jgi:hypothetical protein
VERRWGFEVGGKVKTKEGLDRAAMGAERRLKKGRDGI